MSPIRLVSPLALTWPEVQRLPESELGHSRRFYRRPVTSDLPPTPDMSLHALTDAKCQARTFNHSFDQLVGAPD
jgi:hypothetical protein